MESRQSANNASAVVSPTANALAPHDVEAVASHLLALKTYEEFDKLFNLYEEVYFQYRDANNEFNILHRAINEKNITLFKYIYEKQKRHHALLHEKDKSGQTPVELAISLLEYDALGYLIKQEFTFDESLQYKLLECLVNRSELDLHLIQRLYLKETFKPLFSQKNVASAMSPLEILLHRLSKDFGMLVGNNILRFFIDNIIYYADDAGRNVAHYVAMCGGIKTLKHLSTNTELSFLLKKRNHSNATPINTLISWSRNQSQEFEEISNFSRTSYMKDVEELESLVSKTLQNSKGTDAYKLCQVLEPQLNDLKAIPKLFGVSKHEKFNASDYERLAPMVHAMKKCISNHADPENIKLIAQVLSTKEFSKLKSEKNRIWLKRIFLNFIFFSAAVAAVAGVATLNTLPLLIATALASLVAGHQLNKLISSLDSARLKAIAPKIAEFTALITRSPKPLQVFSLFKTTYMNKVDTISKSARRTCNV